MKYHTNQKVSNLQYQVKSINYFVCPSCLSRFQHYLSLLLLLDDRGYVTHCKYAFTHTWCTYMYISHCEGHFGLWTCRLPHLSHLQCVCACVCVCVIQNEGDVFTYSGSGGKDLTAGNKRRTRKKTQGTRSLRP